MSVTFSSNLVVIPSVIQTNSVPAFSGIRGSDEFKLKKSKEMLPVQPEGEPCVVLEANSDHVWESGGAFNPGVIWDSKINRFRMLYTAVEARKTRSVKVSLFSSFVKKFFPEWAHTTLKLLYHGAKKILADEGSISKRPLHYIGYVELDEQGKPFEETRRLAFDLTDAMLASRPNGFRDPRIAGPFDDGTYFIVVNGINYLEEPRKKKDIPEREFIEGAAHISLFKTKDFKQIDYVGKIGPKQYDKNGLFLPEKVNYQGEEYYMLFHRLYPSIRYSLIKDPEALATNESVRNKFWQDEIDNRLESHTLIKPNKDWDQKFIGATSPPVKTNAGWLLFYHGSNKYAGTIGGGHYKGYLALLDLKEPWKVIANASMPILERSKLVKGVGENKKVGRDVLFPSGAVKKGDEIFLFYGDDDKRTNLIRFKTDALLDYVLKHSTNQ